MSSFFSVLTASGLRPKDIVADGRWRRCATDDHPKKRNGAYRLDVGGCRGWWRNWATDDGLNRWEDGGASVRPVDQAKLRAQRDRERKARIDAIAGARRAWSSASQCSRLHPYLAGKDLSALGTKGLRDLDGWLVIPVMVRGRLISIQRIDADGVKRFWPGAPVKGGSYVIERDRAAITCICEGLATGMAIYQSVRTARVIVAFDAGNLLPVVDELRPKGSVVLCADNDLGTEIRRGFNPGLEKAKNAAELIGAGVAYPEGIMGTDFADALKEWGEAGSRRIERLIQSRAKYVSNTS